LYNAETVQALPDHFSTQAFETEFAFSMHVAQLWTNLVYLLQYVYELCKYAALKGNKVTMY
jgi:hypothetical protein